MYKLFVEKPQADLHFVCEARTRDRAAAIAQLLSRQERAQIVVLRTFSDGASTVVATYRAGAELAAIGA